MDTISQSICPPSFVPFGGSHPQLVRNAVRVWPLAAVNGRAPVVLDPQRCDVRGVDLAYARVDAADALTTCPPGTPNGTATHLMPAMTPALAIGDGVITFAGRLSHGYDVIIDHGDGSASRYANLQAVVAIRTDLYRPGEQRVRAGDAIGYVGAPTCDGFKRLHFELWERDRDRRFVPVDPRPHFVNWTLLQHYDAFMPAPAVARTEAA